MALLALLALLTLLSLLATLAVLAALILTLPESAVAQFLLLLDHVAQLIELRHHIVVVVAVLARRRHLQILHHLLELLQKLACGVLGAAAGEIFQPIEHALEVALAQDARIAIERTRELLIVPQLLLHRLHEAIHRRTQLIHQLLDFLIAGAALERLPQRLLGVAQTGLRVGNVAVFDADRHLPQPRGDFAQIVVALGADQRPEDRTQTEIDAGVGREFFRR